MHGDAHTVRHRGNWSMYHFENRGEDIPQFAPVPGESAESLFGGIAPMFDFVAPTKTSSSDLPSRKFMTLEENSESTFQW